MDLGVVGPAFQGVGDGPVGGDPVVQGHQALGLEEFGPFGLDASAGVVGDPSGVVEPAVLGEEADQGDPGLGLVGAFLDAAAEGGLGVAVMADGVEQSGLPGADVEALGAVLDGLGDEAGGLVGVAGLPGGQGGQAAELEGAVGLLQGRQLVVALVRASRVARGA